MRRVNIFYSCDFILTYITSEQEMLNLMVLSGWWLEFHSRATLLKQTPWPLVRKRTIPTDRSPLVDEI
jgi:hypothetical protein